MGRFAMKTWIIAAALVTALSMAGSSIAFPQAGSTGGTAVKQDKSVSGGEEKPGPHHRIKVPVPSSTHRSNEPQTSSSTCSKALGVWFWVTMEVTLTPGGIAESRDGNGKWTCSGDKLSVYWDNGMPVENFTVTPDGQLTGHWLIKPRRIR
jgi:hypothetical protein